MSRTCYLRQPKSSSLQLQAHDKRTHSAAHDRATTLSLVDSPTGSREDSAAASGSAAYAFTRYLCLQRKGACCSVRDRWHAGLATRCEAVPWRMPAGSDSGPLQAIWQMFVQGRQWC